MNKAVEIKNLSFSYSNGSNALSGINLDIYEGESVGIIGPNGAGKTTLLLHLNGLLNGKGKISIFGSEINEKNLKEARKNVGLVFQDPEDQLFMPTVFEDVAFGPSSAGLVKDRLKGRVDKALEDVGLLNKADHISYHLSLGEKKRVALATILSMEPRILVLDEPSANLDPRSRRHLINLLKGFSVTKIIATHDLEMVLDLCDRVVILDEGVVIVDGKAKEILSQKPLLESHGLEVPPSVMMR